MSFRERTTIITGDAGMEAFARASVAASGSQALWEAAKHDGVPDCTRAGAEYHGREPLRAPGCRTPPRCMGDKQDTGAGVRETA